MSDATTEQPVTSQPPPARTLVAKLAAVMKEVHRVPKRGKNKHFDYEYPLEADVLDKVRPAMAARNLIVLPEVLGQRREGKLTFVQMRFTFHDGDSGETLPLLWEGAGEDNADKGVWKAITGAVKYFLLKSLLIPTGDDPEASDGDGRRTSRGKAPTVAAQQADAVRDVADTRFITAQMAERLKGLMRTHGTDQRAFLGQLKARFGATRMGEIRRGDYGVIEAAVVGGRSLADEAAQAPHAGE